MSPENHAPLPPESPRGKRDPQALSPVELKVRGTVKRLEPFWEHALIFLLAFAAYANSLENQYTFDDPKMILENSRIRSLAHPAEYLATSYWDNPEGGREYRPATMFSYALNFALARIWKGNGYDAMPYHLLNILLHAIVSCLAAWAVMAMFRRRLLAAVTGLLFALHPVHTEVVAGVVGRAELLSAAGFFIALAAWSQARETQSARGHWLWAGALLVSLLVGVAAKENAVTLVGIVALESLVVWRAAKLSGGVTRPVGTLLARQAPCLAAIAAAIGAYMTARYIVLGALDVSAGVYTGFVDNPLFGALWSQRAATALRIQAEYFWVMLWPQNLIADFSYNTTPVATSFMETGVLIGLAAALALAIAFVACLAESPLAAFAIGFYALTMSVTSNIFFPIGTIKGERLLYLPSFGFCLLAALAFERAWKRLAGQEARFSVAMAFAAVCVGYGARTAARNPDWRDNLTLFSKTVRQVPQNCKARQNLADSLALQMNNLPGALKEIEESLRIYASNSGALACKAGILAQIADEAERKGDKRAAEQKFREAEEAYAEAIKVSPSNDMAIARLGVFFCLRGRYREGLDQLELAARVKPRNLYALSNVAWWHYYAARDPKTRDEYLAKAGDYARRALALDPANAMALKGLGFSQHELGLRTKDKARFREALDAFTTLQAQAPDMRDLTMRLLMGDLYYQLGEHDRAQAWFKDILSWSPGNRTALKGLNLIAKARLGGAAPAATAAAASKPAE